MKEVEVEEGQVVSMEFVEGERVRVMLDLLDDTGKSVVSIAHEFVAGPANTAGSYFARGRVTVVEPPVPQPPAVVSLGGELSPELEVLLTEPEFLPPEQPQVHQSQPEHSQGSTE